jgi:hypothetical protein
MADCPATSPGIGRPGSKSRPITGACATLWTEPLAATFAFSAGCSRELVQLWDVAIEHRLMHVETLAYMLHQLSPERKFVRVSDGPVPAVPHAVPGSWRFRRAPQS